MSIRIIWKSVMQEALVELAAAKLTAAEIAVKMTEEFGLEFTRNSIIGRAHRTRVRLAYQEKADRMNKICGNRLCAWNNRSENLEERKRRHRAFYEAMRWQKKLSA